MSTKAFSNGSAARPGELRAAHGAWSREGGWAPPSDEIRYAGCGCTMLGTVMIIAGWRGRRR